MPASYDDFYPGPREVWGALFRFVFGIYRTEHPSDWEETIACLQRDIDNSATDEERQFFTAAHDFSLKFRAEQQRLN